ncbi:MATE family efflux transporter [Clostridium ihumii]|uniref:MATE family efflux transporter n=1 Tax=Clostridium ihumii TaxID=1470356 RepID=UPI000590B49F|nr:MATE family efflux transporter [Clostridium ihumii]
MDMQKRLGEEKIYKLLLEFSIPAIVGMIVNTLYNIVDRMYIGHIKGIGNLALSGVGVAMPIVTVVSAFSMMVGIGTSYKISIKLGENDKENAENHLGNAVTLLLLLSFLASVVGLVFIDPILNIFGASKNTIGFARDYIEIIFIGTVFNMLSFGLNHSIRSDGSPKTAMFSMLIGAIANIILDPIFIFVLDMGVRGAAIATIIARSISTIWILYYFTKGKSILKIKKSNMKLKKEVVISIITIGMVPFCIQIAQGFVQLISNNALKTYGGDNAIAAMAIISSISMIFMMPVFGINQGSQPIIGFNYGAKNYERVKETVKYGVIVATIILMLGFLIIQLMPKVLISMFNDNSELINTTIKGIRIYLMMMPLVGFQVIISNLFQAIGKVKIAMVLSLLRQVIILIPCMIIVPKFKGITGVWLSGAISDGLSAVITAIILVKTIKNMKKKIIL